LKTGYSLLLGEYVEAEALEYHDCEHWQIVCPACKEPLFKCRRETPFVTHYLSHYGKDKAYVDECELRVKAITSDEMLKNDSISREQRLSYFISVFRGMLQFAVADAGAFLRQQQKSKAIKHIRDWSYKQCRKSVTNGIVCESLDMFLTDLTIENKAEDYLSKFCFDFQKRATTDFFSHILSSKSKQSFDYFFNCGLLIYGQCLQEKRKKSYLEEYEKYIYYAIVKLPVCGSKFGAEIINNLRNVPVNSPSKNALTKMAAEAVDYGFRLLSHIDYREWILKAKESKGRLA